MLAYGALKEAWIKENHEIEQILGKALGYPELYPDVSKVDDGTVCVRDHVAVTLVQEAAAKIKELKASLYWAENWQKMRERNVKKDS